MNNVSNPPLPARPLALPNLLTYARIAAVPVVVALLCVVLLFPLYWMFVTAVPAPSQVLAREPALVPAFADMSFRAFTSAFARKPLATWLTNSLIVTVGATGSWARPGDAAQTISARTGARNLVQRLIDGATAA